MGIGGGGVCCQTLISYTLISRKMHGLRKRLVQWLQQVVHDSGGLPVSCSTPSLPCCHVKTTNKSANLKTVSLFVFFFTLACEQIFIKTHSS